MSVLDERTGVAVEVNGFLRIEKHCLLGVHLHDEVFQCTETDGVEEFLFLILRHVGELSGLDGSLFGLLIHLFDEVIRIHDGSFPGFHLALRKFHHAV